VRRSEQVVESVRTGRPTLYRPELAELARKLALLGLTESEMADALNVDVGTLSEWKARHREFREAIERGGVQADAQMAERLYHRGLGYQHEAVKIFMPAGAEAPVYAPYTQRYPPDTQAASLWLRNRQPERWRDKREVDHMGSLEHRISLMTPEERLARLRELQAKARLAIEASASEVEE
jgi:transcriptional regulator with XRE-family HTH domain